MSGRVIVVGSLNVDTVLRVDELPAAGETVLALTSHRLAGGKGANQAVAARAAGAQVVMVAAVGADEPGLAYAQRLADLGIESVLQVQGDAGTGAAYVTLDVSGENSIVVAAGANARLDPVHGAHVLASVTEDDVVLCSLEVPVDVVHRWAVGAYDRGARVIVNCAPYAALPAQVLTVADPLVCNESEARRVAEDGTVPSSWLVTFGRAGASWDGVSYPAPVVPEDEVVDTTGAGDAFCGALAAALAAGAGRSEAVARAQHAGALAVQRAGAQPDPAL